MCPSYHGRRARRSTDARPRASALRDDAWRRIERGWRDAVPGALDLCLACKGCKSDCPVNVDMATYKAEFRSHYYAGGCGRVPPIRWASSTGGRASRRPRCLARTSSRRRPAATALKRLGGHRAAPQDAALRAARRFTRVVRAARAPRGGAEVMLFPDTFNNFFRRPRRSPRPA
jgi:Fe-S oxidoreductase